MSFDIEWVRNSNFQSVWYNQAVAWSRVAEKLSEVYPEWTGLSSTGADCAVAAIENLAKRGGDQSELEALRKRCKAQRKELRRMSLAMEQYLRGWRDCEAALSEEGQ